MADRDVLMKEKERARKIKMIIMDVDGTLTDGSLLLLPDGEELKSLQCQGRDGRFTRSHGGPKDRHHNRKNIEFPEKKG